MQQNILYEFVKAINGHEVDKICDLMTEDHCFIDAHGNEVIGKDKMKRGWAAYFEWFPDYQIEITQVFEEGDTLAAFGFAGGTFKNKKTSTNENQWRVPSAWKAVVRGHQIKRWQVFADTKLPFDIIAKNK